MGLHSLTAIVTARCNLRCRYCCQGGRRRGSLAWGALRPALDLLLASRERGRRLIFTGGEPMLEAALVRRAVSYVSSRAGTAIRFELVSNGLLLDASAIRDLDRRGFDIQVSMDGVRPAQALRGTGTFARLDALLASLRRRRPALFGERLSVAMTVTAASVKWLAESVRYLLDKGVEEIVIAASINERATWADRRTAGLDAQFREVVRAMLEHHRRTGRVPVRLLRPAAGDSGDDPRSDWTCGATTGRCLAIDVDGEASGCVMFARSYDPSGGGPVGRRLGRLRLGPPGAPGFAARLHGYTATAEATGLLTGGRSRHSGRRRCSRCRYRRECLVCPIAALHLPGNGDPSRVPDFQCAFNRAASKYRRRLARLIAAADARRDLPVAPRPAPRPPSRRRRSGPPTLLP